MILKRSGSCDATELSLLSKPLKQYIEESVVSDHLVQYTCGSLRLATRIKMGSEATEEVLVYTQIIRDISMTLLAGTDSNSLRNNCR